MLSPEKHQKLARRSASLRDKITELQRQSKELVGQLKDAETTIHYTDLCVQNQLLRCNTANQSQRARQRYYSIRASTLSPNRPCDARTSASGTMSDCILTLGHQDHSHRVYRHTSEWSEDMYIIAAQYASASFPHTSYLSLR